MRAKEFAAEGRKKKSKTLRTGYYYGWYGDGTSTGDSAVTENNYPVKFVIYVNGVPATTYDSLVDAKKDLRSYRYEMPDSNFKIYRQVCKDRPVRENNLDRPTPDLETIAAKHNVTIPYLVDQVMAGIRVELEHTTDLRVAKEIALDHLNERPDYYQRLKQVE